MKQPNHQKLRLGVFAAIAAGSQIFLTQAADLIAGWDFETVEADGISINSKAGPFVGVIVDGAILTDAGGGRPGAGGGKGFDVSLANPGYLYLEASGDDNPMNIAAADDQMSVVLWQKNVSNVNSSSFWAVGEGSDRAFQFHIPWSDGTIYFDTSGGCCTAAQRLSANVVGVFPDHDWLEWHHYAFIKDGGHKAVYIDGVLLVEAEGFDPVNADIIRLSIGAADRATPPDAVIDDFAIFRGALSETEIMALAAGGSPFTPPVDTDGDGMPDDWETQYGFNPNSPADAPLDADNDGATNVAEYNAGTNPTDTTKPTLVSAVGNSGFNQVTLVFSEALDPVTAETAANYSLSPSVAVTGATLKKNTVTLTTAAQTPGAVAYTVTVVNVLDTSKNAVAANTTALFYSYNVTKTGVLKFSFWGDITGTSVLDLQADPRYPATPDSTGTVFSFNTRDILPTDSVNNYGATVEGLITPTESGDYNFFLRGDDGSELHISTDNTEANLALQAYDEDCCDPYYEPSVGDTATTAPIAMVAGTPYFIRVIYKEGGGGDYAQVAWRKTTDTTPAASLTPIPGKFLTSLVDLPAPPEGAFVTQTPAANAKNVSPATAITIAHRDGNTPWTAANVSLKLNGAAVTPVITKDGNVLTISYVPPALLASASVQTVSLGYLDPGGNPATLDYSFTTFAYSAPTVDKVASRPAYITGSSKYTAAGGGKSGQAGDYGMDLTTKGGALINFDASWANVGTAKDELSVVFWQKKYDTAASSAFWFNSPASADTARGFQAHNPWSDGNIYFDTAGASDTAVPPTRLFANIDTFAGYTGDIGFWTNSWRHFAFTKKGGLKQVWIDGQLFLQGDDSAALQADFTSLYIGSDGAGGGLAHGLVDDFAVFTTQLVEADLQALNSGTLPSALPAAKGLVAYWDFNDAATTTVPTISINGTTITFTGTLTSTGTIGGAFAPVTGATSPYTIPAENAGPTFYRSAD